MIKMRVIMRKHEEFAESGDMESKNIMLSKNGSDMPCIRLQTHYGGLAPIAISDNMMSV